MQVQDSVNMKSEIKASLNHQQTQTVRTQIEINISRNCSQDHLHPKTKITYARGHVPIYSDGIRPFVFLFRGQGLGHGVGSKESFVGDSDSKT